MKRTFYLSVLSIVLLSLIAAPSHANNYKLDPTHSSILFKAKHFDIGYIYGMFLDFSGEATYSPEKPSETSMKITIQTESIFTNVKRRDDHLIGPDFFNAKQFPEIKFQTTSVQETESGNLQMTGNLTMSGATNEVTTTVKLTGSGEGPQGKFRRGFETKFTINRMNYGVDYMPDAISKEIPIIVSGEFVRQ